MRGLRRQRPYRLPIDLVTLADIEAAAARLAGVIRATPTEQSANLGRLCGRPVLLKPEHLQRTGSFKIRGAYNHISRLPAGSSVVAASAGNHAQGVALAASLCGFASTIFMPRNAAIPKVTATQAYGATVRLEGATVDECMALARSYAGSSGAAFVPPFDDPYVIAGQGTVGLEIAATAPPESIVVVPVGGGGLIAGIASAVRGVRPDMRIVGVEASGAPTMRRALDAGSPVVLDSATTIADGTALRSVSPLTLSHAVAHVDDVVTVSEDDISRAVLLLLERSKYVVEPSGALGLAALLTGRVPGDGPVVTVCTGGNVDPLLLIKLIEHGLSAAGRYLLLRASLPDSPGNLASLLAAVAAQGANLLDVSHFRTGVQREVGSVEVLLTLETRSDAHQGQLLAALAAAGYEVTPLT